ncbi:hypothetical protein BDM02DRAFT_3122346 [Thelephora ganbajun]|uniref:Uncharacterized protein n=1 Tax=Thelephora ganbajun TaxID=370292 RepID=A0ACB6Z4B8_THEGA|nr:hypothetical protein BDM02DRAFT_3122346 [Thelephora ganbajun]
MSTGTGASSLLTRALAGSPFVVTFYVAWIDGNGDRKPMNNADTPAFALKRGR